MAWQSHLLHGTAFLLLNFLSNAGVIMTTTPHDGQTSWFILPCISTVRPVIDQRAVCHRVDAAELMIDVQSRMDHDCVGDILGLISFQVQLFLCC